MSNSTSSDDSSTGSEGIVFDIVKIRTILKHRYPFLLVDRVTEFVDGERITGIKCVSANEEFFQGHFPEMPIMPGVLIMEAIAQAGAILAMQSTDGTPKGKNILLVGCSEVKWRKPVVPGDVMKIEVSVVKRKKPFWIMEGRVFVDGKVACSGTVTAAEADQ